jgi:hypothetical protein
MPIRSDLLELVSLFNRQKTDLPDGVLHRNCVFRLNGLAYHEHLGRPPQDPLIRLVGCGPAGYRFVVAALRHAVQAPRLALQESTLDEETLDTRTRLRARGALTGRLRGSDAPFSAEFLLELTADRGGHIGEIAVALGDPDVEILLEARGRP